MDFWQPLKFVFRRWYISLPAFLPVLGIAILVYASVPTQVFDNQYLLSLVDVGGLRLVAFMGIFVAGIYAAIRARFTASDVDRHDLSLTWSRF